MKTNILCMLLFLTPIIIKPMLTNEFTEEHLSESENKNNHSSLSRRERSKSMLYVLEKEEEEAPTDSDSIVSETTDTVEVDVIKFLEIYFDNDHTGQEPYCQAVKDVLTGYRDNHFNQFEEIAHFLDSIEKSKDKKKAFNRDFLDNKRHENAQALLNTIFKEAITSMLAKKKFKVEKTRRVCRMTTGACVGSFLVWCGVLLAAVIPAVTVQC